LKPWVFAGIAIELPNCSEMEKAAQTLPGPGEGRSINRRVRRATPDPKNDHCAATNSAATLPTAALRRGQREGLSGLLVIASG
jgi:hypothetical protein